MATHDYVVDNGTGLAVRTDINDALAAISSNNSDASDPGTTYAYMWHVNTADGDVKLRNSANSGWVKLINTDGSYDSIGIGTASPAAGTLAILDSSGDASAKVETTNTGSSAIVELVGDNTGTGEIRFGDQDDADVGRIVYDHSTNSLTFTLNATAGPSFDSNGALSLPVGAATTPSLYFGSDTNTGFYSAGTDGQLLADSNGSIRFLLSGNLVRFKGAYNNSQVSIGANLHVDSAGELIRDSSSRDHKTGIEPIEESYATALLENAEPVYYKAFIPDPEYPQAYLDSLDSAADATLEGCNTFCYANGIDWDYNAKCVNRNANPDWGYWGFIAEDLAEVDPRLCSWNEEKEKFDGVSYANFAPMLLKLLQMQKAQITALEERIANLEAGG